MAKRTTKMNFGQYDQMPTEALNTLLSLDLDADSGVDLEPDAVLYILEVIRAREKADATAKKVDVKAAWESFNKDYRPAAESIAERYAEETPIDEADEMNEVVEAAPRRKTGWKRFSTRGWIAAAAVVAVIVVGMVPSRATGTNLWTSVVQWVNDTFGLEHEADYPDLFVEDDPCRSLRRLARARGITDDVVPTWLPGDAQQQSIEEQEQYDCTIIEAIYKGNQSKVVIKIYQYSDDADRSHIYEKNFAAECETYTSNGVVHYFSQNDEGRFFVLWELGDVECFIRGDFTREEAERLVDSIYQ